MSSGRDTDVRVEEKTQDILARIERVLLDWSPTAREGLARQMAELDLRCQRRANDLDWRPDARDHEARAPWTDLTVAPDD